MFEISARDRLLNRERLTLADLKNIERSGTPRDTSKLYASRPPVHLSDERLILPGRSTERIMERQERTRVRRKPMKPKSLISEDIALMLVAREAKRKNKS